MGITRNVSYGFQVPRWLALKGIRIQFLDAIRDGNEMVARHLNSSLAYYTSICDVYKQRDCLYGGMFLIFAGKRSPRNIINCKRNIIRYR